MRISQISNQRNTSATHSQGMRRAFLVAQVVFSVVLLTGAGLLIRSFLPFSRSIRIPHISCLGGDARSAVRFHPIGALRFLAML